MNPVSAKGVAGAVAEFDGKFVTISRKGLAALGTGKSDRRIPIGAITMVNWKKPGPLWKGFIHFETAGSPASDRMAGSATKMTNNADAVWFSKKQMSQFEELRAAIESALADRQ